MKLTAARFIQNSDLSLFWLNKKPRKSLENVMLYALYTYSYI